MADGPLAEQVGCGGAEQFASTGMVGWLVGKATNDARGSVIEFAADESSGTGEFIDDRLDAGVQSIAVRIASAAIVA